MMEQLFIVCVDDQRNVLSSLSEGLELFADHVSIETCESADEAWDVIDELDAMGDHLAIVISDQVMPGKTGVEFLAEIAEDGRFPHARKVLLTGLATHKDTIAAINQAGLDNYIEKPWKKEDLHHIVRVLLTQFILTEGLEYNRYMEVMDQETLFATLRNRP